MRRTMVQLNDISPQKIAHVQHTSHKLAVVVMIERVSNFSDKNMGPLYTRSRYESGEITKFETITNRIRVTVQGSSSTNHTYHVVLPVPNGTYGVV